MSKINKFINDWLWSSEKRKSGGAHWDNIVLIDVEQMIFDYNKELRIENKALKETLDKTTDLVVDYQERLDALKNETKEQDILIEGYSNKTTEQAMEISGLRESRDELLEACKYGLDHIVYTHDAKEVESIIKKAEAQKEKETG